MVKRANLKTQVEPSTELIKILSKTVKCPNQNFLESIFETWRNIAVSSRPLNPAQKHDLLIATEDVPDVPWVFWNPIYKVAMDQQNPLLPKHLNEHQAADITGLSVKTLRRMRHEMRGPQYVKLGRRVVYSEADLGNWLHVHRVETGI